MPGLVAHNTTLEAKIDGVWEEVANVRGYPQLKGAPEQVDTSVVTGENKTYAHGQKDPGNLEFLCAYGSDKEGVSAQDPSTNYGKLKKLEHKITPYRVRYPDNSGYELEGSVSVGSPAAFQGANNALEFPIYIAPVGEIVDVAEIEPISA